MFKKLICPIAIILFIASCSKSTPTPPATTLTVTVKDTNGGAIPGASVYLFASLNDMTNAFKSSNLNSALAISQTDNNGNAIFKSNLTGSEYYFFAEKGCENNFFGGNLINSGSGGSSTNALTLNENNYATCTLYGTGTLTLTNNSSNPYEVYEGDLPIVTSMAGNSSNTIPFISGSFNIEWKQLSGYVLYPTIDSVATTISCGGSASVSFP